jgi:hypothetical protein
MEITESYFIFLIGIIFLETFIIIGDWINDLALRKKVMQDLILPSASMMLKMMGFVLFTSMCMLILYPTMYDNIAIGVMAGIVSGYCILIIQKRPSKDN